MCKKNSGTIHTSWSIISILWYQIYMILQKLVVSGNNKLFEWGRWKSDFQFNWNDCSLYISVIEECEPGTIFANKQNKNQVIATHQTDKSLIDIITVLSTNQLWAHLTWMFIVGIPASYNSGFFIIPCDYCPF